MYYRLPAAILAVIAVPIAAVGQQPAAEPSAKPERRSCETTHEIGSRLSLVRRCRSKSERDAHKQEARQTVDRVQALKVTFGK
jgi:hypothetical protein